MLKKFLVCLLLVLTVVAAMVFVISLSGVFNKITVDESDTDDVVSDEDQTYGHTLIFAEDFFEGLAESNLEMYVDGKRVTEAPASGKMQALYVSFYSDGGVYSLEVDDPQNRDFYSRDSGDVALEFHASSRPVCIITGDITFISISKR